LFFGKVKDPQKKKEKEKTLLKGFTLWVKKAAPNRYSGKSPTRPRKKTKKGKPARRKNHRNRKNKRNIKRIPLRIKGKASHKGVGGGGGNETKKSRALKV